MDAIASSSEYSSIVDLLGAQEILLNRMGFFRFQNIPRWAFIIWGILTDFTFSKIILYVFYIRYDGFVWLVVRGRIAALSEIQCCLYLYEPECKMKIYLKKRIN